MPPITSPYIVTYPAFAPHFPCLPTIFPSFTRHLPTICPPFALPSGDTVRPDLPGVVPPLRLSRGWAPVDPPDGGSVAEGPQRTPTTPGQRLKTTKKGRQNQPILLGDLT